MKKLVLRLLILIPLSSHAATVRIKNESNAPVWARINDQIRKGAMEVGIWQIMGRYGRGVGLVENVPMRAMSAIATGGLNELLVKQSREAYRKKYGREHPRYQVVPNFKKIAPGTSKMFNSGTHPIKKITFLRVREIDHVNMPKNNIMKFFESLTKQYGNIAVYRGFERKPLPFGESERDENRPFIGFVNDYTLDGKSQHYTIPLYTPRDTVRVPVPILEPFSIEPKISALNIKARVIYEGWQNAYNQKKIKGIQKIQ